MKLSRRQILKALSHSFLVSLLPLPACGEEKLAQEPDLLESFAFGSCNKQDQLQAHWPIIQAMTPQGWIWMGDAIYADETLPRVRAREYRKVRLDKAYMSFLEQAFVLGTWDDHDYASNDARSEYELRDESQQLFLDFIGEPLDSPRRLQRGVYQSRDIGKPEQAVQFILLDMRYFSEAPGTEADPLGATQWAWLEEEIKRPGPQLKVIVSSIQCLTTDGDKETWASFPKAQERLLALLARSPVQPIILSGDRHLVEFSKISLGEGRVIHEITASGLTHFEKDTHSNSYRLGETIHETNFGMMNLQWNKTDETSPVLESITCASYSPQHGGLLRELPISLKWVKA